MTRSTMTSREFNQDAGRAKRAARAGPVFITDRGRPAHVLLTIEEYRRLAGGGPSAADVLSDPKGVEIEFDPPRLGDVARAADLS
jgi:prevent-host-death family protein